MKLGLTISSNGSRFDLDENLITEADKLGFHSLWTSESWGHDAVTPAAWALALTKNIKVGTKVELFFPSLGNKINAKITQVGNFINPDNRSFKIRIDIKNENNDLKPNLLADLKINDFASFGIVVPSKLIQKDRLGNSFVYTLNKVNDSYNVNKSYIKEKMTYKNESFISEGLSEDVLVVDKGSRLIKEGEIVILSE